MMKDFKKLYKAGRVTRYHTADVPAQSLAAHSWGVSMVVAMIYPNKKPPAHLLMAAMIHDLAESVTGDVPAPTKWGNEQLSKRLREAELVFNLINGIEIPLTPQEEAILAWADTFELCLYCRHQASMGNEYAGEILSNGLEHLRKKGFPTTESKELYDDIFGK